jgi:hypothetical protein
MRGRSGSPDRRPTGDERLGAKRASSYQREILPLQDLLQAAGLQRAVQ